MALQRYISPTRFRQPTFRNKVRTKTIPNDGRVMISFKTQSQVNLQLDWSTKCSAKLRRQMASVVKLKMWPRWTKLSLIICAWLSLKVRDIIPGRPRNWDNGESKVLRTNGVVVKVKAKEKLAVLLNSRQLAPSQNQREFITLIRHLAKPTITIR